MSLTLVKRHCITLSSSFGTWLSEKGSVMHMNRQVLAYEPKDETSIM